MDLNQKLSEHFQLWEFVTSQVAQRNGINNNPTPEVIQCLKKLCETVLEPARFALGPLRISSGYRCPALNKAVGGAATSAHQFGFAADVLPLKVSKLEFAKWIVKNVPFDQIILEYGTEADPAWIHVSADPRHRKKVMRILNGTGYQKINL
ncbi:MAG: D-Ala-D-Ala carboxypeptidase family metallohydrolase [Candidatus Margulisiibacteriota bacterium]